MESITLIVIGICVLFLLLCFTIAAFLYVSGVLSPIDVGTGTPPIGKVTLAYKFARGPYKGAGDLFNEITKHAPEYKCLGIYYDDPRRIPEEKLRYAVGAVLSEGEVKVEKEVIDKLQEAGFKLITLPEVAHSVKTSFPFINTMSILIAVWRVYPRLSSYIEVKNIDKLQEAGFKLITLPEVVHSVKTSFPFINTMSILIAVWRVYPRLSSYIEEIIDKLQEAGFKLITLPEVAHSVKTSFPFINTMSILIAVWRVYPRLSSYIEEHKLCAYPFLEIYEESTIHFMAPLSMQDEFFVPESKENIPSEYGNDSMIDNTSGTPSFYDDSPSSSASRSMSRYTNASHMFSDDPEDSDGDYSFYRDSPSSYRGSPSVEKGKKGDLSIQDEEITSSIDVPVRPSKAKTNLLEEESDLSAGESEVKRQASPVLNKDAPKLDESGSILHDSGVCSGRTSAVPSANASMEVEKHVDGNDSASSFEEINME